MEARDAMGKAARGRRDKDKTDGAVIKTKPLKESLRELGELKIKASDANTALKDAVKAIAEKTGLLVSVVRRMVNAQSGDRDKFEDEKRKVEQLGIVFEEIAYEGEVTKEVAKQYGFRP